ncbi:uncharacterized protein LOC127837121 [Dreissena polymorpha]|uniref:Transmembrane protein n=1 Tax=Dreissena polymorpha TaxID=45954 RepID=A0A9D4MXW6_DREPO|nr:uncharacterized protein LOC127837121 [Dreissena polymorpha]KAH3884363.1 hypothetical protein DPMN_008341 [Dreissena polymorpha]
MASVFDFIRSAVIILGIGFNAQQNRKTWMWGDSVMMAAYSLSLFLFPMLLFPGTSSTMLAFLTRVFASLLMGLASFLYLSRKTRDENVVGVNLWTRLMSSMFVVILMVYTYFHNPGEIQEKTVYFDLSAFMLLLVASVYQFWRGGYRVGGREQKGHVSTVLRIIFLMDFSFGILHLAFPSWVIPSQKLNPLETLMMREIGALVLGLCLISLFATTFHYDEDRGNFFFSNIVSSGMMLLCLNYAYFKDGLFDHMETLRLHLAFVPSFLAMLGLYLHWRHAQGNQSEYNLRSKSK